MPAQSINNFTRGIIWWSWVVGKGNHNFWRKTAARRKRTCVGNNWKSFFVSDKYIYLGGLGCSVRLNAKPVTEETILRIYTYLILVMFSSIWSWSRNYCERIKMRLTSTITRPSNYRELSLPFHIMPLEVDTIRRSNVHTECLSSLGFDLHSVSFQRQRRRCSPSDIVGDAGSMLYALRMRGFGVEK